MSKSRNRSSVRLRGLTSLCLIASLMLSGCSTVSSKVAHPLPPANLYDEYGCSAPERLQRGATNGELVRYVRGLQDAVVACQIDRAAIRAWAGKVQGVNP